jgi:transporter family protein
METDMVANSLIFALLAMVLWGVAPLFGKAGLHNLDPVAALTVRSSVITLALVVFVVVTGRWSAAATAQPREIAFIALEGFCAALLGQLAYYYALKYGEISKVTPVVAAFPLVTLVLGLAILGEKLTWGKAVGGLLVVAGVVLINYR